MCLALGTRLNNYDADRCKNGFERTLSVRIVDKEDFPG
jgi:hypothetical protein